MKNARKMLCAMIVVIALCALLVTPAFAAETGNMWLNVAEAQANTNVVVCADTTVTNGQVELRYDSSKLTFRSVTTNDAYVSVVAVNTDTEGVVKIAWVAPGYYEAEGTNMALITVLFEGVAGADEIFVTGNVYDAEGQLVNILSARDTSALEEAIAKAEGLDEKDYTEESYAAVEEALEEAKKVLADPDATQEELDAAVEKLNDAMDALVKDGNAETGDGIASVIAVALLSAAMTVCLVSNKKGWCAK